MAARTPLRSGAGGVAGVADGAPGVEDVLGLVPGIPPGNRSRYVQPAYANTPRPTTNRRNLPAPVSRMTPPILTSDFALLPSQRACHAHMPTSARRDGCRRAAFATPETADMTARAVSAPDCAAPFM